jgi:mannose-1-phosphate guanylyltransferase/phosphomannomutase
MKAIVLCAGRGTRLGDLTTACPKPLLPVAGRPLLEHILRHLSSQGIGEVLINLHFLPAAIPAAIGDGSALGLSVTYVEEPVLLGTAGTVRAAREWIGDQDTFVVYGDILTDQDFTPMIAQHIRLDADATLLLHHRKGSNSVVEMDPDRRITLFRERPKDHHGSAEDTWVNSGIQILSPRLVAQIPGVIPADLPHDVYAPFVASLHLYGFPLTGRRVAVDSPVRLAEAGALVDAGGFPLR